MFTGIIQYQLPVKKSSKTKAGAIFVFPPPKDWQLKVGESINIDGVCTTVTKAGEGFTVFYMPETLKVSTLGNLNKNHLFNLERSLTLNDLVGGHLVYGHVDTTAKVKNVEEDGDSTLITFTLDKKFTRYLIYKGSVAVNGVSLTVVSASKTSFQVALIPFTLKNTNLGELKVGDLANIEVDMIAKYIEKLISTKI